eukprot:906204-Ditylum_brightwellii.AAC.1
MAHYVLEHQVSWSKHGSNRVLQWARKIEHDLDRAVRQIVCLYDTFLDDDNNVRHIHRVQKGSKKQKKPKANL